jgi:hypothetical protein
MGQAGLVTGQVRQPWRNKLPPHVTHFQRASAAAANTVVTGIVTSQARPI